MRNNGYIQIPVEIILALSRIRLSGEVMQILLVIIRKTMGWHKEADRISLSQFVLLTGIKKQNVCRAINKLTAFNIVKKEDSCYSINRDIGSWVPLSELITDFINNDYKSLSKMRHTKDTKQRIYQTFFDKLERQKDEQGNDGDRRDYKQDTAKTRTAAGGIKPSEGKYDHLG